MMDVKGMVDKRNIFLLFGCYCNSPKLIIDKRYETSANDYNEVFHKMIWGALNNISRRAIVETITPIDIQNELSSNEEALKIWQINDGVKYIEKAMSQTHDKIGNVANYYNIVKKYSLMRNANINLGLDTSFIYNENNPKSIEDFSKMTYKEVLMKINEKFINFKKEWTSNGIQDNYGFHAGDDINSLIEKYKNQDTAYGYPHQSKYLTTIFRGMRFKKFMLRSCPSGMGKSRMSMAEACNIATDYIYDWNKKEWIFIGEKQNVLFISTELEKEEVQACLLAHISGIDEDRITEWDITDEEEVVLMQAMKIMDSSKLFCEFISDFTISDIEEIIERYIINNDIRYVFFDYINETPSLMSDYVNKAGTSLKTHQVLFLFSNSLKLLANKYGIYLSSSTQLSSNWKEDNQRDANALKGSKAIAEKVDYGVLGLPVTAQDLKKLNPIFQSGFYDEPNMAYYIYKNRGGKYKSVIVWTRINLGTVRETDCFVTNLSYELIDVEKTDISFFEDVSVGFTKPIASEDNGTLQDRINDFNNINLNLG